MAKKILLIDDEELIIKSLKKLLEKDGFTVFIAKNGQDALSLSDKETFDVIIADIRMPGINGVETIKSLNETIGKRGLKKPGVIFITGYADEEMQQEAEALGPVAYIYKPFDISELISKIKEAG